MGVTVVAVVVVIVILGLDTFCPDKIFSMRYGLGGVDEGRVSHIHARLWCEGRTMANSRFTMDNIQTRWAWRLSVVSSRRAVSVFLGGIAGCCDG